MKKNKEKREPLMYIHQPEFVFPEPVMQSTYHTRSQPEQIKEKQVEDKQESKEPENRIHEAVKREKPMMAESKKRKKEPETAPVESEPLVEEKQEIGEQPVWRGMRPVKRFYDMEMDEKLQHLMTQFTSLPCVFDCGEVSHKGILREVSPDQLKVQTLKGETVIIERKDLQHIQLLGPL
ncbi:CotO family spore coat protein [Pseudobacillus sp. FSL P4-0506]|uniref:CotO family spore coat protein n=1 Tax=unclassified Pseudobacillus TaxID=2619284 RepID=UPI0030F8EAC6